MPRHRYLGQYSRVRCRTPRGDYSVDLTVEVEERIIAKLDREMFCCGGLISILAAPFIIHRQYMKAGNVSLDMTTTDMMPHLETAAESSTDVMPPMG